MKEYIGGHSKEIRLALIGRHCSHSLSKEIHEFTLRTWQVPARYDVIDIPDHKLSSTLQSLWTQGYHGLNVTSPYKRRVAAYIGQNPQTAVNTLWRGKSFWCGASSDAYGFRKGLWHLGCRPEGLRKTVILGCGGVVPSLLKVVGQSSIVILRRSLEQRIGGARTNVRYRELTPDALREELEGASTDTLLVQATSAPLKGDDMAWLESAIQDFSGFLVELNYGKTSRLLAIARKRGMLCQDGLTMLIEQALRSQELWFAKSANYEAILGHLQSSD